MSGPSFFDANQGASTGPSLEEMASRASEAGVMAALERIEENLTRMAEREADEPLDDGVAAELERLSGHPDAPLDWRSLHARVGRGVLTWADLWRDPGREGPEGTRLVLAVARTLAETVTMMPIDPDEPGHRPPGARS